MHEVGLEADHRPLGAAIRHAQREGAVAGQVDGPGSVHGDPLHAGRSRAGRHHEHLVATLAQARTMCRTELLTPFTCGKRTPSRWRCAWPERDLAR